MIRTETASAGWNFRSNGSAIPPTTGAIAAIFSARWAAR
jgi:hypothetical protein